MLTDFGIAHRDRDPGITTTGVVIGSASYLAPERARGGASGPAADLWALGATLYTALEGHGPFERDGQLAALDAVLNEPAPEPRHAGVLAAVVDATASQGTGPTAHGRGDAEAAVPGRPRAGGHGPAHGRWKGRCRRRTTEFDRTPARS
ncbi:MAG: hypothetical protein WKF83_03855 [Nocardioidaceae bacterium]